MTLALFPMPLRIVPAVKASCLSFPPLLYCSYSSHYFILALNDSIDFSGLLVVVVALLLSILSIRAANLTHSWQICSTTPGFFPSRSTSKTSIDIVPFRLSTVNFFLIKLVIVNLSFSALNLEICIWLLAEDQSHHQSCRPALAFSPFPYILLPLFFSKFFNPITTIVSVPYSVSCHL